MADKAKKGVLIRKMRMKQDLTQKDLALKLKVPRRVILQWEMGKRFPNIELLDQLADVLELSIDELVKGHTYEINEQNLVEIKNPYNTDFQECYLHFCTSMEGVALCPGPTDYLTSIKDYVDGYYVKRLFRVKAEGHCVNIAGDWWVTNTLTVLEEVSKNEIYQYYIENSKAREQVSAYYKLSPDFWKEFLKSEIKPYVKNSK